MAIRKNASQLSLHEITTFVSAIKELKLQGRYDLYVLQHARAVMMNIHRCPGFLTWHRQLLWELEKELQSVSNDPNLAIPYWHWGENAEHNKPEDYPMWSDNFLGPGGRSSDNFVVKSGPFREGEWVIVDMMGNPAGPLTRALGQSPTAQNLPTKDQIEALLRVGPYDVQPFNQSSNAGFRNLLEGWYGGNGPMFHNLGHVWAGGSMLPMTSPNDPLFFLHHCFVDKLWWDWQQRNGINTYIPLTGGRLSQNLNDNMEPGITGSFSASDMLDVSTLGYSYDIVEPRRNTNIVFTQGPGGHIDNSTPTTPTTPTTPATPVTPTTPTTPTAPTTPATPTNPTSPTTPVSPRGKGCLVLVFSLLVACFIFACSANINISKLTSFEVYENKEIVPSTYWYFDVLPGNEDVYKIFTTREDIYFEVPSGQNDFSIGSEQMETSKVKVITKDNRCYLGNNGNIKGQLDGNKLNLELNFESLSARSNAQGELIIKDKTEKLKHSVKASGLVYRVKK
jgi:tyrosinase-like protein